MIAVNNHHQETLSTWQSAFVAMLPEIQQRLRHTFRRLDTEAREEAIAEGVVHCLLAYARLQERGRESVASASSLAWYAAKHVKRGRPAVGRMNNREPLSRYAQLGQGIHVERLLDMAGAVGGAISSAETLSTTWMPSIALSSSQPHDVVDRVSAANEPGPRNRHCLNQRLDAVVGKCRRFRFS